MAGALARRHGDGGVRADTCRRSCWISRSSAASTCMRRLLPKYRGPAPIQWAVINGETETGVTTMLTDAGIDTGDILLQRGAAIGPEETAGELFAQAGRHGGGAAHRDARAHGERRTEAHRRRITRRRRASRCCTKDDGRIDWNKTPEKICNLVRGVNPWPGAWTRCRCDIMKIWKAEPAGLMCGEPGRILKVNPQGRPDRRRARRGRARAGRADAGEKENDERAVPLRVQARGRDGSRCRLTTGELRPGRR